MATQDLKDIGQDQISEALVKAEGSIQKAAYALNVRTGELRRFCMSEPNLREAALEAAENALDRLEWRADGFSLTP